MKKSTYFRSLFVVTFTSVFLCSLVGCVPKTVKLATADLIQLRTEAESSTALAMGKAPSADDSEAVSKYTGAIKTPYARASTNANHVVQAIENYLGSAHASFDEVMIQDKLAAVRADVTHLKNLADTGPTEEADQVQSGSFAAALALIGPLVGTIGDIVKELDEYSAAERSAALTEVKKAKWKSWEELAK